MEKIFLIVGCITLIFIICSLVYSLILSIINFNTKKRYEIINIKRELTECDDRVCFIKTELNFLKNDYKKSIDKQNELIQNLIKVISNKTDFSVLESLLDSIAKSVDMVDFRLSNEFENSNTKK